MDTSFHCNVCCLLSVSSSRNGPKEQRMNRACQPFLPLSVSRSSVCAAINERFESGRRSLFTSGCDLCCLRFPPASTVRTSQSLDVREGAAAECLLSVLRMGRHSSGRFYNSDYETQTRDGRELRPLSFGSRSSRVKRRPFKLRVLDCKRK
jgi:hypothetical protein